MDTTTTDTAPSLMRRAWAALVSAWGTARTRVAAWRATDSGRRAVKTLLLVILGAVLALGLLLRTPGPKRPASDSVPAGGQPVAQPATAPLQAQIDALRLRVIVLETRADAPPKPSAAPRASTPRAGNSTPAAPTADQFADTSKLVESPTPPAPITRQSIDQFRASLRTPQPVQE